MINPFDAVRFAPARVDFLFTDRGSVWTVEAFTEAAQDLAREHLEVEGWQGIPERFTADHGPASRLAHQLRYEGWTVVVE